MKFAVVDGVERPGEMTTIFRDLERSARQTGRADILIRLDRIADLRGPERQAEAEQALLDAVQLLNTQSD